MWLIPILLESSILSPASTSADVAQLEERERAMLEVAGSNPVFRSILIRPPRACLHANCLNLAVVGSNPTSGSLLPDKLSGRAQECSIHFSTPTRADQFSCGCSSAGRAPGSHPEGRGFESRLPLHWSIHPTDLLTREHNQKLEDAGSNPAPPTHRRVAQLVEARDCSFSSAFQLGWIKHLPGWLSGRAPPW